MDGFAVREQRRRPPDNPKAPYVNYREARRKWNEAGQPVRSDDEVKHIFEGICKPCEYFVSQPLNTGRCKLCSCQLNLGKTVNKIRWATESCPDDPPKWVSSHEEAAVQEVKQTRRERRKREREEKKRVARMAPEPVKPPVSDDELAMYDRTGRDLGHVLRDSWSNWQSSPAAFLVGSGPSLNEFNLEPLRERGVMSLGINNVAAVAPVRAMIFSDPPEKFHTGIFLDAAITKFVPKAKLDKRIRIRDKATGKLVFSTLNVGHCPSVFAYRLDYVWRIDDFFTAKAATLGSGRGCPRWEKSRDPGKKIIFTMFAGLRLLHYLGIRTVYLLGVDFAMVPGRGYAFPQDHTDKWYAGNNRYYRDAAGMFKELRPMFEARNFNVFQCNPTSHLRVFDYVPYQNAVEHCRAMIGNFMPGTPEDMRDWYVKAGQDFDERDIDGD